MSSTAELGEGFRPLRRDTGVTCRHCWASVEGTRWSCSCVLPDAGLEDLALWTPRLQSSDAHVASARSLH